MNETVFSKEVRNRISRNLGHLAKVKEMIDNGESFGKIMLQLSAVRKSLSSTSTALVAEQAQRELAIALRSENPELIEKFFKDYAKFF